MIPIIPSLNKPEPIIGESGVKNKPFMVIKAGYIQLSNGDWMYFYEGFCFDNASIPKLFKWLYDVFKIRFFHYLHKSFLVHDYLYAFRGYRTSPRNLARKTVSRLFADKEMMWQMSKKYTKFKCNTWFFFVRLLGFPNFGKI